MTGRGLGPGERWQVAGAVSGLGRDTVAGGGWRVAGWDGGKVAGGGNTVGTEERWRVGRGDGWGWAQADYLGGGTKYENASPLVHLGGCRVRVFRVAR